MNVAFRRPGPVRAGMAAAGWCGLFYAWALLPLAEMPPLTVLLASALICAFSCLALVFFLADIPRGPATALLVMGACINLGLNHVWPSLPGTWLPHLYLILDLSLMAVALGFGCLLSRGVSSPGHILPLVVAAGLADIWSVFHGVTKEIVQSPVAMNHLLIHYPVAGQGIRPLLGVMDFAFAALFVALSRRFSLSLKKTAIALGTGFTATILLAGLSGAGLPLLPGMGLAFVLVHYRDVRMTDAREKRQAAAVLCLIAVAFLLLTFLRR